MKKENKKMEFSKESIANLIYDKMKFEKMCKSDLDYAYQVFITSQEYEKCSVINDLLEIKYYDNRKRNNNEEIMSVQKLIDDISSGSFFINESEFMKQRNKIEKLKNNIEKFYYMMIKEGKNNVIIPPFRNKKNIEYFLNI